jgi:uncharacterized protein DUF6335
MSRKGRRRRPAPARARRARTPEAAPLDEQAAEMRAHEAPNARLSGGDVDADAQNAWSSGDEAVGGSTATPDQDVVDELGEALGVAQAPDAEVRTSAEILAERDRHRWLLEREAELRERRR